MKPPPPMPATYGSVTPRVALAAIAASTALPPARSTWIAALVASGSTVAAAPCDPVATARDAPAPAGAARAAVTRTSAESPVRRSILVSVTRIGTLETGSGQAMTAHHAHTDALKLLTDHDSEEDV